MDRIEGLNYPSEKFLDFASHEWYKEIWRVGFCLERAIKMKGMAE